MNRYKSFRGAFVVSLIFNIVLLAMLTVIGINSVRMNAAETVSETDIFDETVNEEVPVIEIDVPSEEDRLGDGEDLIEVTTTTPAPVVTTTATTAEKTTTRRTSAGTTRSTTARTTTTAATTTTTQKPTTTTTKGSGDNDAGFEDIIISPPSP